MRIRVAIRMSKRIQMIANEWVNSWVSERVRSGKFMKIRIWWKEWWIVSVWPIWKGSGLLWESRSVVAGLAFSMLDGSTFSAE